MCFLFVCFLFVCVFCLCVFSVCVRLLLWMCFVRVCFTGSRTRLQHEHVMKTVYPCVHQCKQIWPSVILTFLFSGSSWSIGKKLRGFFTPPLCNNWSINPTNSWNSVSEYSYLKSNHRSVFGTNLLATWQLCPFDNNTSLAVFFISL